MSINVKFGSAYNLRSTTQTEELRQRSRALSSFPCSVLRRGSLRGALPTALRAELLFVLLVELQHTDLHYIESRHRTYRSESILAERHCVCFQSIYVSVHFVVVCERVDRADRVMTHRRTTVLQPAQAREDSRVDERVSEADQTDDRDPVSTTLRI